MPFSRLRLRLAAWFGSAFILGLLILDVGFLTYAGRKAESRLTREVTESAAGLEAAIQRERQSSPNHPLDKAVSEALDEWPAGPDVIAIFDNAGRRVASRGPTGQLDRLSAASLGASPKGTLDRPADREGRLRIAWVRDSAHPEFTVVTGSSTAALVEEQESLRTWLLLTLPLLGLGAAGAGYVLARRALRPVQAMARELDAIDERRLEQRLPVRQPADELDHLAARFNSMLERLATARETSRRFVSHAAHQLRTPLTIVRGESGLGLERTRLPEDYRDALRRINLAAEQMSRRVGELFLLAEAEAGERPVLHPGVELDGIAVEAVDLMRGRASALARTLEFGQIDEVIVQGDQALLREAMVELLENACRHGSADSPVRIAVFQDGGHGIVEVTNAGPPISENAASPGDGLGLAIVRWVAEAHAATLTVARRAELNAVSLAFPLSQA